MVRQQFNEMQAWSKASCHLFPFFFPQGKIAEVNNITHVKDHKDGEVIANV